jgi:hypothetical protein
MVPMGLGEVVGFDLARTATANTEAGRRRHTTALVLLLVALIGLVVALVTADNHRGVPGVHTPRQAVTYLCSHCTEPFEEDNGWLTETNASAISSDGRTVVFTSNATNLVPGDINGMNDAFVEHIS